VAEDLQQLADTVTLGAHQHLIEPEDENGKVQKFIVHRPTMRDQLKIGMAMAAFLTVPTTAKDGEAEVGGQPTNIAPIFAQLAEAVATLSVVLDLRPADLPKDVADWTDTTLVWNAFTAFGAWLDNFRGPVLPGSGTDSGTPESA
jgi:hypothetical protein